MTEVNNWSHATYYMLAAGCHISGGNRAKAKELLDKLPGFLDTRKFRGKEIPTEVWIKKKLAFYKAKQKKRGGSEADYVDCIRISPAEELAVFWNTHARITHDVALAHVQELSSYSPPVSIASVHITTAASTKQTQNGASLPDLDTPDELAIRALILGIVHRALSDFTAGRAFLQDAHRRYGEVTENTWVGGIALFEWAVLDIKEAEAKDGSRMEGGGGALDATAKARWAEVLEGAIEKLDKAMAISGSTVDLSSRLDTRVNMLRDEIAMKREMLGLSV